MTDSLAATQSTSSLTPANSLSPSCWRACCLTVIIEKIILCVRDIFMAFVNLFREHPEKRLQHNIDDLTQQLTQKASEVQQLTARATNAEQRLSQALSSAVKQLAQLNTLKEENERLKAAQGPSSNTATPPQPSLTSADGSTLHEPPASGSAEPSVADLTTTPRNSVIEPPPEDS